MRGRLIALFALAGCAGTLQAGEIYRCVAANGDVSYTNIACPDGTRVQRIASYEPVPDVPAPQPSPAASESETAAIDARLAALEEAQARELALAQAQAQAQAYYAAAQAQREQAESDNAVYFPAFVPAYPFGGARLFGHGGGHRHPHSPSHHDGRGPSMRMHYSTPSVHPQSTMFVRQR